MYAVQAWQSEISRYIPCSLIRAQQETANNHSAPRVRESCDAESWGGPWRLQARECLGGDRLAYLCMATAGVLSVLSEALRSPREHSVVRHS